MWSLLVLPVFCIVPLYWERVWFCKGIRSREDLGMEGKTHLTRSFQTSNQLLIWKCNYVGSERRKRPKLEQCPKILTRIWIFTANSSCWVLQLTEVAPIWTKKVLTVATHCPVTACTDSCRRSKVTAGSLKVHRGASLWWIVQTVRAEKILRLACATAPSAWLAAHVQSCCIGDWTHVHHCSLGT